VCILFSPKNSGQPANDHESTGASVFESELLLNGIVIQKLEYERFVWKYMDILVFQTIQT
jgi:hypothetical protein